MLTTCPYCRESIQYPATVCPYCRKASRPYPFGAIMLMTYFVVAIFLAMWINNSVLGRDGNVCIKKLEALAPECQRNQHGLRPRECSNTSQERYQYCSAQEVTGKVYLVLAALPFALAGVQMLRRRAAVQQSQGQGEPRFVFRSLKRFWFLLVSFLSIPALWFGYVFLHPNVNPKIAQLNWYENPGHLTALGFLLCAVVLWLCRNKRVRLVD